MVSLIKRIPLAAAVLLGCASVANADFQCPDPTDDDSTGNGATAFTAGPVNQRNGGPLWLRDSSGLRLEVCLDQGKCFFDSPDGDNPYSERVGFGPEAFWYLADAGIKINEDDETEYLGFSASVVMGAEFAWINEDPNPGEQFPFTRLRLRLQVPALGTYYVTHPYGR